RTDDYGQTWTKIVAGIAPNDFARAIREDVKVAKLLYLGTEHGVYLSFDDGANWQSLRQNLPDTPVHDIAVEQRDLVIATHGRGRLPATKKGSGVRRIRVRRSRPDSSV